MNEHNANKPWLSSYPTGVPIEIDPAEFSSIGDILRQTCDRYGSRTAFINKNATLSYDALDRLSRDFAAYLLGTGLKTGDRVAIMLPNLLQYPVVLFGILRAGLVVVNTNPLYTSRELQHQLADSGAKAIVIVDIYANVLAKIIAEIPVRHVVITGIGDLQPFLKGHIINFALRHIKKLVPAYSFTRSVRLKVALKAGRRLPLTEPKLGHEDLAFLQYTGGTTGLAKGAMLSHGNLIANMLQLTACLHVLSVADEFLVTALPLYHIFALTSNCLSMVKLGGTNLLITNPSDLPGLVRELERYPFTAITGVNTLFNGLLNTPGFAKIDFSSLKVSVGGGMAVQRSVAEKWKAVTGVTLIEAYGLTETSPGVCVNPLNLTEFNGSIGIPLPSTECCIMDEDGERLPAGEAGELCIRGPQVMQGYWQRPEETARVITEDGWLLSGDIAVMDSQGYFSIVDRKKDLIIVSGFNVYPNEIEDVVAFHPKVLEVAAIGVADDKSGEAVKLCVVKSDDTLSEEELRAYCKENLTGYKRPRHIRFYPELPKTNVGKILRRKLREADQA